MRIRTPLLEFLTTKNSVISFSTPVAGLIQQYTLHCLLEFRGGLNNYHGGRDFKTHGRQLRERRPDEKLKSAQLLKKLLVRAGW